MTENENRISGIQPKENHRQGNSFFVRNPNQLEGGDIAPLTAIPSKYRSIPEPRRNGPPLPPKKTSGGQK